MATLADRLKEVFGDGILDVEVREIDTFEYSFSGHPKIIPMYDTGGYERARFRQRGHGTLEFQGVYHPNIVCEGIGICVHCGMVL